ncbi:GAF and ANTAR domain-containing protein [Antrihabitans sp. YC2-6]|uniref:GAF and ANTAR domain-containing protein n=1 Tax=Antrihabitans sp. YC2-6 TaxID=2799498 RepID=UPI0018F34D1D|nr:GAF and ANTAR domain-containing protein [Antrihabitans sp. YC2-6]MBJ8348962.1 GAF and ANTAR domain-containing protein [Antrihabitans sp. YC2-6]
MNQEVSGVEAGSGIDAEQTSGWTDSAMPAIMAELARRLHSDQNDYESTLATICESAKEGVPGAQDAGITLRIGRDELDSRGATGDLPAAIDRLQELLKEGPCVDAAFGEPVVRVDDMSIETRWPKFGPAAAEAGVGSMLSYQLWVEDVHLGALNLYSKQLSAFDASSDAIAEPLAAHASVAISSAKREKQLKEALVTRDVIGQAKGMLMERYSITPEAAFDLLTKLSQETNLKLRDISARLIEQPRG